jgi:hypothetical protein
MAKFDRAALAAAGLIKALAHPSADPSFRPFRRERLDEVVDIAAHEGFRMQPDEMRHRRDEVTGVELIEIGIVLGVDAERRQDGYPEAAPRRP